MYSMLQNVIFLSRHTDILWIQSFSYCDQKTSSDAPVGMQIVVQLDKKYILKNVSDLSFACIPLLCKYKVV